MQGASGPPPGDEVWIGDDAAVVAPPTGPLLLCTDAAVAGVHADLALVGLEDLGWKALTATVSDIAAMGGRPLHALVTYLLAPGTDIGRLATGVAQASARWHCVVTGGDLSAADQVAVVVAVTGTLDGPRPPVTRAGARPGDALFVTGPLGASAAGLRLLRAADTSANDPTHPTPPAAACIDAHRRPLARLAEGAAARAAGATAMIDVSDGLSIDLHRLADASGVGFALDLVPVADAASLDEALGGGEDYELVVATTDPDALTAGFAAAGLRSPIAIGRCTADPAARTLAGEPLTRVGYEHPIA